MKQTIFDFDYLTCTLDDEASVLSHEWKRKPSSDEFKEGLMKVYDTFVENKPKFNTLHWLGNTKNMGVLGKETKEWLDNSWNEALFVKAGVRSHAVLVGTDIFGKYAMQQFSNTMSKIYKEKNLKMGVFETEEQAYEWFVKNGN